MGPPEALGYGRNTPYRWVLQRLARRSLQAMYEALYSFQGEHFWNGHNMLILLHL